MRCAALHRGHTNIRPRFQGPENSAARKGGELSSTATFPVVLDAPLPGPWRCSAVNSDEWRRVELISFALTAPFPGPKERSDRRRNALHCDEMVPFSLDAPFPGLLRGTAWNGGEVRSVAKTYPAFSLLLRRLLLSLNSLTRLVRLAVKAMNFLNLILHRGGGL